MKRFISVVLAGVLISSLSIGCSASKKPLPQTPAKKPVPQSTAKKPLTQNPLRNTAPIPATPGGNKSTGEHQRATKLAAEVDKIPGVKKSAIAIQGNTAYVGLDLDKNIEAGKTNTIKKECKAKIQKADNKITQVIVSSDVDTVTRIKKVAKGVEQGKPISTFVKELEEIGRRITPSK